jgi:hypothetical protein
MERVRNGAVPPTVTPLLLSKDMWPKALPQEGRTLPGRSSGRSKNSVEKVVNGGVGSAPRGRRRTGQLSLTAHWAVLATRASVVPAGRSPSAVPGSNVGRSSASLQQHQQVTLAGHQPCAAACAPEPHNWQVKCSQARHEAIHLLLHTRLCSIPDALRIGQAPRAGAHRLHCGKVC